MSPVTVWTLVSLVGCAAAVFGVWDAYRDLAALRGDDSGRVPLINGRRTLARSTILFQVLLFGALSLWAGLGAYFWSQGIEGTWSPATVVLTVSNVLVSTAAVLIAYSRVRIREELIKAVREGHPVESVP